MCDRLLRGRALEEAADEPFAAAMNLAESCCGVPRLFGSVNPTDRLVALFAALLMNEPWAA